MYFSMDTFVNGVSSRIVPLHGNLYYGGLVWLFRIEVFGREGRSSRFLFEILRRFRTSV